MKRIWQGAAAIATVMAATSAQASLAPEYYLKARATAPLHLQVQLTSVEIGKGTCTLTGRTVQSFREPTAEQVSFTVDCLTPDVTPMPGPDVWFRPERFVKGAVIEGFFQPLAGDGRIAAAMGQMSVVPAARERPWCAVDDFTCELP
ncbi:hypothetical protein [Caulobacter sp. 17J80-11]|uniref:hypothetical protein n=1 Tax=Caulobacter sp. 17J80-11 TaxID=2763502 RepID=UPI0016537535|nr:hypothetical protein [Caulobacter sp. 17J80-11]MBC6981315.1 hypothetical protein [Caulobacter sp. 17J80-11]